MEKGFRSRSNSPGQQDRQALPLQPSRFASNLLSPDDGYDYGDSGPSPEGSASKEKEDAKEQNVIDSSHYAHNRTPTGPEAFPEFDEPSEATRKIFERPGGGTRAKRPDQPNCIDQPPFHVNGQPSSPVATGPVLPKSRWRRRRSRSPSVALNTFDKLRFRHVMLQWEREEGDIDGTQRLILRSKFADAHAKIESPNHVTWQHSEFDHMRLENFQDIVNEWKSHGLQDSEAGLTRRVLKRVRTEAQRPFAGGSFLTPTAFRYDILDDSRYSADKCCIFLSFPYFAVAKPQATKSFGKGDPRHPMRTLLQSYYRLNDTSEKDKEQCIRMLDGETLKSCINAPEAEVAQLSCGVNGEVIHVPQMWALVLGSNKMITTSPISDVALQGSSIKILDDASPPVTLSCAFLQISFLNLRGALEELTYPMEQCASWFGLMRRQQHIRDTLRKGSDPRECRFYIGKQVIQDRTWASVQRSAQGAVLKVWMKTPKSPKAKGPIPKLSVQGADSDSDTGSKVLEDTGEESELDEDLSPETAAKFDSLDNVPIVSAFLAWRILDEFGEQDDSSPETKTMDFLNAIYRTLPATCERNVVKPSNSTLRPTEPVVDVSKEARPKILIVGRTLLQFDELIRGIVAGANGQLPSTEQKLREECDKLLNFFIPRDHDRQLIPIQLYWGALYEIVSRHISLVQLLEKVKGINVWAETIHLGVHCRRMVRTSEGNGLQEDAMSESAILLASMVNALGAIFNMLVQGVRDARLGRKGGQGNLHSSISFVSYGDEACTLLRKARDELITEATSALPGEHIGPVLTPETILVMVMERLGRGVFGSWSVDIVAIYEECLEHLALTVKSRPSRRLLQTINAFEEEVMIVIDVLLQQKRVLSALQDYLNPGSFKRPTIVRKMRFEFEEKGIERIRTSIREQLRYCAELRARAKVLAVQNVHLVETLQDDSGRAILVFTFISVFFLPLSFVASFFGMNVVGITGTASTVRHFWAIALPITAGIMTIGGLVVFYGESIWFALVNLPHTCQVLLIKGKGKRKTH